MLCCLKFTPKTPIRRFQSVWVYLDSVEDSKKKLDESNEDYESTYLGNLILIILLRKELPNFILIILLRKELPNFILIILLRKELPNFILIILLRKELPNFILIILLRKELPNFIRLIVITIFRLLTSSLLLYSQRFGRYVFRSSSGVSCRTGVRTESRTKLFI